jgi:hypothetical protein
LGDVGDGGELKMPRSWKRRKDKNALKEGKLKQKEVIKR